MKGWLLSAFFLGLGPTTLVRADAGSDYLSIGIRVGALVAQQRMASPPLPSLGRNKTHQLKPEISYLSGNIRGYFGAAKLPTSPRYEGKPYGYAGGLAYKSPSWGRFAFWAFGMYMKSTANSEVFFQGGETVNVSIQNAKTLTKAAGLGVNYLLVGDVDSFFAMGAFAGAFYAESQSNYDYVWLTETVSVSPIIPIDSHSSEYGPEAGLQIRLLVKKISLTYLAMYALDQSDQCLNVVAGTTPQPCLNRVDNSFASMGVSVGLWRFGLSVYGRIWSKIESDDFNTRKYQLNYTMPF